MTGDFVKKKLKNIGIPLIEVALNMGISSQNLESKLKSNDVKVGVLENIAKAINKNVYFFFEDYNKYKMSESTQLVKEGIGGYKKECNLCFEKERVILQQKELIDQLKKIIKLLEDNK